VVFPVDIYVLLPSNSINPSSSFLKSVGSSINLHKVIAKKDQKNQEEAWINLDFDILIILILKKNQL
jgi:hypothetical protein